MSTPSPTARAAPVTNVVDAEIVDDDQTSSEAR